MIFRGHEFYKKETLKCGTDVWRCSQYKKLRCKATLWTKEGDVSKGDGIEHSHEGNAAKTQAKQCVAKMKQAIDVSGQMIPGQISPDIRSLSQLGQFIPDSQSQCPDI